MKAIITGLTGHCAPHLAKQLLVDGHEVHAIVRETSGRITDLLDVLTPEELGAITIHYGDLTDFYSIEKIFKENKFDWLFHLGAMSHPPTSFKDPLVTAQTNILGTMHLIEAVRLYNSECIIQNTSTSEVYGDSCKDVGILKEDLPLIPNNPYGWSKMCAETYLRERCKNRLVKGFSTRAFSHFAPRRGKNFSISWDAYHLAMMKIGKIEHKNLPVGNLKTKRVVVDARDVVDAYYKLMKAFNYLPEKINGESFNVCGPIEFVKEMEFFTDTLIDISGLKGVKKVIDKRVYRDIDIKIQVGDTTKLNSVIGWKPTIPIEQSLTDLFNYWIKKLS